MIAFRAEIELLALCTREGVAGDGAERIRRRIAMGLDWDYLREAAAFHCVTPLVYWTLNSACPDSVPNDTLTALRESFVANANRNLFLTSEMLDLLAALESAGVEAAPLKGPLLASALYGNLALRRFADLDLLIRRRDASRALDLLRSIGFRQTPEMSWAPRPFVIRWNSELSFERGGVDLDLQWELAPSHFPFHPDMDALWSSLRPVSLGGRTVRSLPPEALLLFLAVHGAKHRYFRLSWISDIARLVAIEKNLDWDALLREAEAWGARKPLIAGLLLARDLLGAPVPDEILGDAPEAGDCAAEVTAALASGDLRRPNTMELFRFNGRMTGFHRGSRHLAGLLLDPTRADWETLRLPRPLLFCYRPYRLIRLAAKYLRLA